ncbi:MAG: sodium-dependent transporter [Steroidobacteraceae bacterium]
MQASPRWSSGVTFYLVTVGAAVGLGSIWRFPYLAGANGGSAFVLVFAIACLVIATPLLVAEFLIGRRAGCSPPEAAGKVAASVGGSRNWNVIGVLGSIAAFLIISYYTVIAGWVAAYAAKAAGAVLVGRSRDEVATLWKGFLSNPWEVGAWHAAFLALVGGIAALGVNRGIEIANRIRAPGLLGLMLILVAYALTTGDVARGLSFAFKPNFSAITPAVVLAAIGQAFYATGVGMAMMLAYGAYLTRGTSLIRSSLIVSGSILVVSLLSTLIVFPLVFRYEMNPAQGVDLVFDVLASVFAEMPAGRLVGTLFYVMLIFAALTPSLAGIEPLVAWLEQRRNLSRRVAVLVAVLAIWVVGLSSVLSFNVAAGWRPLGWLPGFANMSFFDAADYLASNLLLPIGALITSVFVGWRLDRAIVLAELSESKPLAIACVIWCLRYFCPIALIVVLIANAK